MKERPIIFGTWAIPKILDGTKTQTRRVIKPLQPIILEHYPGLTIEDLEYDGFKCPYGQVGDRLWVRETFVLENDVEYRYTKTELEAWAKDSPIKTEDGGEEWGHYHLIPHYRATEPEPHIVTDEQFSEGDDHTLWKPAIHMPRWASRITLEITGIRIERLQEIDHVDAECEGVLMASDDDLQQYGYKAGFKQLWDSLNAKRGYGWETNPWVWVIEFVCV